MLFYLTNEVFKNHNLLNEQSSIFEEVKELQRIHEESKIILHTQAGEQQKSRVHGSSRDILGDGDGDDHIADLGLADSDSEIKYIDDDDFGRNRDNL